MVDTSPTEYSPVSTSLGPPPISLPSTVEETLSCCPRFRILTGVGKSSLIASIFNVSQEDIDIADGHAGIADINREYTSDDNPRFALHDSKGFEPGSSNHWGIVEDFIRKIPVIVVFTKFDLLFNEFYAKAARTKDEHGVTGIDQDQVAKEARGFLHTLEELTDVTRNCLHTKETFVPWAVAQRIDPKQKVQTSIESGISEIQKE
ncbi:hypothetical protein C0993_010364 [Termitomyces sp. T159_Od127]|nr:hypothetical protein C0993_010364 [Termitomyces sp. T159_Od127]